MRKREPPNWFKKISPQYNTSEDFRIPERQCDYCPAYGRPDPDPIPQTELFSIPQSGLLICRECVQIKQEQGQPVGRLVTG